MGAKRTNPDYLNGVPELLVLQLLSHQAMHGYELLRAIEAASGRVLEFGEGCIYPLLHRLQHEGAIHSQREIVQGRSRVVYRLTTQGHQRLAASRTSWQRVVAAVERVLTQPAWQGA